MATQAQTFSIRSAQQN